MGEFHFQAPGASKFLLSVNIAASAATEGLGVFAFASTGGVHAFLDAVGFGSTWSAPKHFHLIVGIDEPVSLQLRQVAIVPGPIAYPGLAQFIEELAIIIPLASSREAGGRALRSARRRQPLPDLRPARASGVLRRTAAVGGDVRHEQRTGDPLVDGAGDRDRARMRDPDLPGPVRPATVTARPAAKNRPPRRRP